MEEIWKDIEGYENLYQVSNMGRVRSLRYGKSKILKNSVNKGSYCKVGLVKNSVYKNFYVHRLVAIHFIPNPDNKPHIDHINTDRTDNTVFLNEDGSVNYDKTNLRWVTNKENHNNSLSLHNHSKSNSRSNCENYKNAVLKPVIQLSVNGKAIKMYPSCSEAARQTNTNHNYIRQTISGRYELAKGFRWLKYEDFERWY